MSIIHVNQIRNQLEKLFQDRVDMSDLRGDPQKLKPNFLTRALAAYSIYYLAQAEPDVAAASIVDGGNDNGIDAVFYDEVEKVLYIAQAKFMADGKGEPENGEVKKFLAGIRDLFDLSFDRFNAKVRRKEDSIVRALNDPTTKYRIVLAYTGINGLAEPSKRDFDDLLTEMNDANEVLYVTVLSQSELHASLTAGISGEPINLDIGLVSWGRVQEPQVAYYGQVNGAAIVDWWTKYRARLFSKNLRSVLGDTDVNDEIRDTIANRPEHFWYFNNGITLVSRRVGKTMVGGADTAFGMFHCEDVSVVNGAQTVGTIGRFGERTRDQLNKVFVQIRIIALENGNATFGEDVTKTNNRQNRIENRDFVSLDPEQKRIQTELAIDEIEYHIVRSDTVSRNEQSFDLVESTTALACASGKVHLVVQLKREVGKLWEDINKAPYKELFNPTVSGLYTWRTVQVQRLVDRFLEQIIADLGTRSGRDYGVAVHGNRMIAALVFGDLPTARFSIPAFDFGGMLTGSDIGGRTRAHYQGLRDAVEDRYGNAILPTLFKNATKCKHLMEVVTSQVLG